MKLSIVIVTYRSWEPLSACLRALLSDGFRSGEWEVIVVDNDADTARLEAFAAGFPEVRFVANDGNYGYANGCNRGAAEASGDDLLFLNPDVVAEPAGLDALLVEKEGPPRARLLTARQLDGRGRQRKVFDRFHDLLGYSKTLRGIARKFSRHPDPYAAHEEKVACDWISGSVVLIDREAFDQLGGWCDEFWMYSEDADLCRRAADLSLGVAYTPRVTLVHTHGGASRRNLDTTVLTKSETVISKHVYIARHFEGLHALANHAIVATITLLPLTLGFLLNLVTLDRIRALGIRSRLFRALLSYYAGARARRSWLSPRSIRSGRRE